MATRNITRRFKQLREQHILERGQYHPRFGSPIGLHADGAAHDSIHSLPPRWVDTVEDVKALIRRIETKIERLHGLHQNRLLVRFDRDKENSQEREIEAVTSSIRSLFKQGEAKLKLIALADGSERRPCDGDEKVRENIQSQLARTLQSLTMSLSKSQKEYKVRLEAQKSGVSELDGLLGPDPELGKSSIAVDGLTDEQLVLLEVQESAVEERDQEIRKISQSINELSTIFKELAVLVIDQGTILDRIDYNMETVVEQTQRGVKELEKAATYSKSNRPIKCIAVLVVLILILSCILIAKHT